MKTHHLLFFFFNNLKSSTVLFVIFNSCSIFCSFFVTFPNEYIDLQTSVAMLSILFKIKFYLYLQNTVLERSPHVLLLKGLCLWLFSRFNFLHFNEYFPNVLSGAYLNFLTVKYIICVYGGIHSFIFLTKNINALSSFLPTVPFVWMKNHSFQQCAIYRRMTVCFFCQQGTLFFMVLFVFFITFWPDLFSLSHLLSGFFLI